MENEMSLEITPQKEWSVDQLGAYVRGMERRQAVDAWRIGLALCFAKALLFHGAWKQWQEAYCPHMSASTIRRYTALAKFFKEEEIQELGLSQAYSIMDARQGDGKEDSNEGRVEPLDDGGVAEPSSKEDSYPVAKNASSVGDSHGDGLDDAGAAEETPTEADESDDLTPEEAMLEVLSETIPYRLRALSETLAWLKAQPKEVHAICWSKVDPSAYAGLIANLREELTWLMGQFPRQAA